MNEGCSVKPLGCCGHWSKFSSLLNSSSLSRSQQSRVWDWTPTMPPVAPRTGDAIFANIERVVSNSYRKPKPKPSFMPNLFFQKITLQKFLALLDSTAIFTPKSGFVDFVFVFLRKMWTFFLLKCVEFSEFVSQDPNWFWLCRMRSCLLWLMVQLCVNCSRIWKRLRRLISSLIKCTTLNLSLLLNQINVDSLLF